MISPEALALLAEEQTSLKERRQPEKCNCCKSFPVPFTRATQITRIQDEYIRQKNARLYISQTIADVTSAVLALPSLEYDNEIHSHCIAVWILEFIVTSSALSDNFRLFIFHR